MRTIAAWVTALLVVIGIGIGIDAGTAGPATTRTPATRLSGSGMTRPQLARTAAETLLDWVLLPPGAQGDAHEPPGDGARLSSPAQTPGAANLVDLVRFAVIPGSPTETIRWIAAHRPTGSTASGAGSGGHGGAPDVWFLAFSWPPVGHLLDSRGMSITATALAGGGTGVRIDAQVTWLPAKPPADLAPAGATILTAELSKGLNPGGGHPLTTTTDKAVIMAIRKRLDALPVASPGATHCPRDIGQALTLRFYVEVGGPLLATFVADTSGCQGVEAFKQGRRIEPTLRGLGFASFVEAELGWRVDTAP